MSKLDIHVLDTILTSLEQKREDYTNFFETGTLFGETVINIHPFLKNIVTVELSLEHYMHFNATKLNMNLSNVHNFYGDSIIMLPGLLLALDPGNTIFWLDGHWSAGDTARGLKECPLLEECKYIDMFCKSQKCTILVDDYTLFGTHDYYNWSEITTDAVEKCFKNYKITKTKSFEEIGDPASPYWRGDIFSIVIEK